MKLFLILKFWLRTRLVIVLVLAIFVFKKLNWTEHGINIDGEKLTHLRFADDIILLADDILDMDQMLQELNQESEIVGFKINIAKKTIYNT